jgi:hypothetical protein
MAQTYTINGVDYTFPDVDDSDWGQNVTDWAGAVSSFLLQRTGGTFTLSAEIDFGATYGLMSAYLKSKGSNIATTGFMRLSSTDDIAWRNNANDGDLLLSKGTDDKLEFNSIDLVDLSTAQTLTNKTLTSPVINTGVSGTAIDDNTSLGSSATKVPTQNAVKSYVDAQLTASSLGITDGATTTSIDLDSETLTIASGEGIDAVVSSETITISGEEATDSNKGVATFNTANFLVSSGDVTIKDGGVSNDELAGSIAALKLAGSIPDSKLNTISTANKVDLGALDIDGATELGGAIADLDKLIIDDGGAGAEKSLLATRIPTYVFSGITGDVTIADGGAASIGSGVIVDADVNSSAAITQSKLNLSITNSEVNASAGIVDTKLATIATADKVSLTALNIDGGTGIDAVVDADLFIVDDGAGGTNKKATAAQLDTYIKSKTIVECINAQVTGSLTSVTIGTDLFSLGMYKALRAFTINEFSVTVTNEAGTSPSGSNLDIRLEKKDTGIGNTGWTELGQIDIDTSSTATSSPSISEAITSGHFIRVKPITFPTNPPSFHLVVKGVE